MGRLEEGGVPKVWKIRKHGMGHVPTAQYSRKSWVQASVGGTIWRVAEAWVPEVWNILGNVGPSWGHLGAMGQFGAMLGNFGAMLGSFGAMLGHFGAILGP